MQWLHRVNVIWTWIALTTKAIIFIGFFWWARVSAFGDAALQGILAADVLAFLVFGMFEWNFRRLALTWGLLFELTLLTVFFWRNSLLDVPHHDMRLFGATVAFGFPYLLLRTVAWSVEHAMETSGVMRN